ncbi:PspA/IM30 family protein [Paenibacillus aceris]|uniref:Phage shock protein A n=1 Tax=Paenibacillus aceris TaxID=869555 RepID=A0ABS4HQV7_9BACL|nr:PspA/IM30 family protein [Paenibacillus aceris]MBP1960930.1 phage shock protein A [Paenibacillus aceris]NHW35400.1 PspA/IM30 family protein [Paenibacillus aceris]
MGIFKRVNDIAMAGINEVLDKMENPLSMIKQYIRELEGTIAEAKLALSNQLIAERKYESIITELDQTVQKRIRQANIAIDRNEEEIAQMAVEEKLTSERKLKTYLEQYEAIKQQTLALADQLKKLMELYNELQNKKLYYLSRVHTAHAIQNVNNTIYSVNSENIRNNFNRMEEQIWQLEAKAAATLRVNQIVSSSTLSAPDIAFKEDVRHELERLKEARKAM